MALSDKLVSQFAKLTNSKEESKTESIVYGTVFKQGDSDFVKIDGADTLTPVISTMVIKDGDRVTVMIKNHKAIVTGNITSPGAQNSDLEDIVDEITEVEILIADKVSTEELEAEKGRIDDLITDTVLIKDKLTANEAEIDDLVTDNATINNKLTAAEAAIDNLTTNKLDAEIADLTFATIENLQATDAKINNLEATYGDFEVLVTNKFDAIEANIEDLEANQITVDELEAKFANIDFTNIGQAAIENLFTESGLIKDLVVSSGTITGELVGVTIKGDLIEGGTVIADKLVIKGSDGLYYKLNTDGVTTEAEQTEYNSLNGSVITAKSITATKISVDDLVAFDATIGGFKITTDSIYSGVKTSAINTTRGVYMDDDGQFAAGDASNFMRFFKDEEGQYKLEILASSIKIGAESKPVIVSSENQFYQSTSPTELNGGSWSNSQPEWTQGKYIWLRTFVTYSDGTTGYSPSNTGVCITGNTGQNGADGEDGTNGKDGSDGRGIANTSIDYQAGTSQTTKPTGTWGSSVPALSTDKPYLWTRTTITYTDNTTSVSYSVSSTLDGIEVGGRNLLIGTKDLSGLTVYDNLTSSKVQIGDDGFGYIDFPEHETDSPNIYGRWILSDDNPLPKDMVWGKDVVLSFEYCGEATKFCSEFALCNDETTGRIRYHLKYESIDPSTEWTRYEYKARISDGLFTGSQSGTSGEFDDCTRFWVRIYAINGEHIAFRKPKLEIGNIASDWSPAPEDIEDRLDDSIVELSSQLQMTEANLKLELSETYYNKGDTDEKFESMEQSIIDATSEKINLQFTSIKNEFTDKTESMEGDINDLGSSISEIQTYFDFSVDGLKIGKSTSDIKLKLENDKVSFVNNADVDLAYWEEDVFHVENGEFEKTLKLGNFAFVPRASGNLSFKKAVN